MKSKMKLPANMRGKYVSRAAFARMQAERDRLSKDIRFMVMSDDMVEVIMLKRKYKEKFVKYEKIMEGLRQIAKEELPKLKEKYGIKE